MIVSRREALKLIGATALGAALPVPAATSSARLQSWPLKTPRRTGIHDVAPASDGGAWFTAQASGHLGYFNPAPGQTDLLALGSAAAPRAAIPGPGKAAWVADGC